MNSKTKIVVLHLKELIYTGIFALLGILFLVLMALMFMPAKTGEKPDLSQEKSIYVPGKYTTSLQIGESSVDVEVVVDQSNITSRQSDAGCLHHVPSDGALHGYHCRSDL